MSFGVRLVPPVSLRNLVECYGGEVDRPCQEAVVSRIAPVDVATDGDLAPLSSRRQRYVKAARTGSAVVLVDASLASLLPEGRRWIHPHAAHVLVQILESAAPPPTPDRRAEARIDPSSFVAPTARVGPGAVILADVWIGEDSRIEPNAVLYGGTRIGARVVVGAGAVIGRPGFGWTTAPGGKLIRIPQLGGVEIEDDVELGPLTTVDAGTLAPTRIGRGAKLDAHVHVGHNATIGKHTIVAAQCGFAGSSEVGAGTWIGGQAGIADHITVGPGARIAAKSGVIADVAPGAVVAGYPAVDRVRWLRSTARSLREGDGGRRRRTF